MSLEAQLYWSFRSPYSYLGTREYRRIAENYSVNIALRPVYPIAIRNPEFFKKIDPLWVSYLLQDCSRVAEFRDLPFQWPSPDPVVQDLETRQIAAEQPHIYWLTRLGVVAARHGRGLAFVDAVSSLIWGGTRDWHLGEHLDRAAASAGLELAQMRAEIDGNEAGIDAEIAANQQALEAAGHWGVPCLVFKGEPFFGQDRIELALWRMRQHGLVERDAAAPV